MPAPQGPIRVKVKKRPVVKPPAGDVASSGADYGRKKAAPAVKRELHTIKVRQSQTKDVKSRKDLSRAPAYVKAHPPAKKHKGGLLGTALSDVADVGAAAVAPGLASVAAASDKALGTKILPGAKKAISNAPADAADLAVSTPTSVAKLASDVVHRPTKVPGELIAPYKALVKHPGKFITDKPVSTLLMFAPAGRGPGLAAGRVARVAGKQTLERTAATLPGTALREARTGSKDILVRHVQAKRDVKAGERTMTVRQVQKRVDESFGAQQKHRDRIEQAIARKVKVEAKALPKSEREAFIAEQRDAARGAAKTQAHREYAKEFGATAYLNDKKVLVKPKDATEGVLHDSPADAQAVADKLNRKPLTLAHGGFTKVERALPLPRKPVKVQFVVRKAGDKHAVVPDFVAERLKKHENVGTSMAPIAKALRVSRGAFTRAVLPYRATWLSGQAIEGVGRSLIEGAGPTSYLRAHKLLERHPEVAKPLTDRAVPAGKIGKVMKEFAGERKTLIDEFPDNPIAHALTGFGKVRGIKQVRALHHAVSGAVFNHLNARVLEGIPQTAMLGRALKKHPLMEHHILGLSDKAIDEAARGLQGTHTQVELARAVQRAYGKYSNFGPLLRESIVHWTPFVPWTLNAVKFLTSVLPKDHPILTALMADANVAAEDWRKSHRLSLRDKNKLPFFDMGGYPTDGGNSVLRIGHYTPFGAAVDPTGGLANMVLPQFAGFYGAVKYGVDWKGQELRHGDHSPYSPAETWLYGLGQLAEGMIPLAEQTKSVVTSKHPARAVQHELRVLSSTRVKPKTKVKANGDGFGGPTQTKGDGFGPSTKAKKKGDGFGG
jgi:hypothetical protein